MDKSLDAPSSQSSDGGPLIGDPEIKAPSLKIDFSDLTVMETNLKNVNLRLITVLEKMTRSGFDWYFLGNDIEEIQKQVKEILFHLKSTDFELHVYEKMAKYLKEFGESELPRLIKKSLLSGDLDLLIREKVAKCLKEMDLNEYIQNALRSESAQGQIRELFKRLKKIEERQAALEERVASKFKTEENSSVLSEESNVVAAEAMASGLLIKEENFETSKQQE